METFNELMQSELFGIKVQTLSVSLGIIAATLIIRGFIANRVMDLLSRLAGKTEVTWDDEAIEAIRPPFSLFILLFGVWSALKILPLPETPFHLHYAINSVAQIGIVFIAAWAAVRLTAILENELKKKAADPDYWLDTHLVPIISIGLKVAIGIGIFITVAQTLGYSVSALVASLGIGGVAVALAAKDTLANFFGSVMVMTDKPFRIGDLVKGDHFEGVVEEIGFRSTRIRTAEKTVQVVPNDKIASMIVENLDRRKDKGINMRRVNFTLGLEYGTTAEKMERCVNSLRDLLKARPDVSKEGLLVYFTDFGPSSLNILVQYFITTTDYPEYLRIKQEINLAIMRTVEELGIATAFPTQTIHLKKSE
ncbi:MAG: mechanosensitive ion channel family protein [Nitrospinae bacterium]|nr:mechanosensitive ion channel family protein [Nitrospinota bacterium]